MFFDVVIIGASLSGLYTAELLARKGLKVGLFERDQAIHPARRTYIITPGLRKALDDLPASCILHRVTSMTVEAQGQEAAIPLHQPDLILERNQLRKNFEDRARRAGAVIHLDQKFVGFQEQGGRFQLVFSDRAGERKLVEARTVIGADGLHSQVAREAGLDRPASVPLLQAEIELPSSWDPGSTKVYFDVRATRYFFWLIPESETRGVVGLIGNPGSDLRAILDQFLGEKGFQALRYQSGQAAMHHPGIKPWGKVGEIDVLLVGDAAGQVKVTTVGGMVPGLWGAQAAAESILGGRPYGDTLRPLKQELDLHWWIRKLLEHLDNPGYQGLVRSISPAVARFLAQNNRDEMKNHFWKLPILQPAFVPLGLKLLLASFCHSPLIRDLRSRLNLKA